METITAFAASARTRISHETDSRRIKTILKRWLVDGTLQEIDAKDASRHKRVYIKPGPSN